MQSVRMSSFDPHSNLMKKICNILPVLEMWKPLLKEVTYLIVPCTYLAGKWHHDHTVNLQEINFTQKREGGREKEGAERDNSK